MTDDHDRTASSLDQADEEIGAAVAEDPETLLSVLPHYYRGEISQANTAQDRIDQTTNWAITVLAALLSIVFACPEMPAFLLLVGILVLSVFLWFEIRRYRFYDIYRARVRFFQENVFANAIDPTGVEHETWREELSEDLRNQTFKVTVLEAVSRRVRRIYALLYVIVGAAWVAKVTLFTPESEWTEAAAVPGVDGIVVATLLGMFYLAVFAVAHWPMRREAKGEIHGEKSGEWKEE